MKILFSLSLMAACLAIVGSVQGQNYAIDWHTIAGGGGTSTGGVFSVSGTIGQPDAGAMSGGAYSLVGGFWGVVAVQTDGAPLLSIANDNGTVIVIWPRPADGFLLEQTGALASLPAATTWSAVPMGSYQTNTTHIFINVPASSGSQFYRLRRP